METKTPKFNNDPSASAALSAAGWFDKPGAYVLVDGQYGSTGKGLLASVLGEYGHNKIDVVTTNAGPNSGHTAYLPYSGRKVMTQQIPVAAVVAAHMRSDKSPACFLNPGAVVDPSILWREERNYGVRPIVHPHATVITKSDVEAEANGSPAKIASTGKGGGAAMSRKILRDPTAVVSPEPWTHGMPWDLNNDVVFVETAQGFSLGINSGFFPATTSRECTVQQALSDAHIPARRLRKVAACYRTYPIRVGNTDQGHSGGCYSDQNETSWEAIGQVPELTSVTKRVRRVFTWSRAQFRHSVEVNEPDLLFLNFCNYLGSRDEVARFVDTMRQDYRRVMLRDPETILLGFGPYNGDVVDVDSWCWSNEGPKTADEDSWRSLDSVVNELIQSASRRVRSAFE